MRLLTIAVVLVLALAGAGCGGGDDEASSDTDTVVTETVDDTTTDETTTDETTTDDDLGNLASGDCRELIEAGSALSQAFGAAGSDADLEESSEAFSAFVDAAPEEIRADLQVLADVYEAYAAAIREAGIEAGETPSAQDAVALQQALASIDLQEFTAASERFNAWATENC